MGVCSTYPAIAGFPTTYLKKKSDYQCSNKKIANHLQLTIISGGKGTKQLTINNSPRGKRALKSGIALWASLQ